MYNKHPINADTKPGYTLTVLLQKLFAVLHHYQLVPLLKGEPVLTITPLYYNLLHNPTVLLLDRHIVSIKCPLENGRSVDIIHTIFKEYMHDNVTVTVNISDDTNFKWDNSSIYGVAYLTAMLDTTWVPFVQSYRVLRIESAIHSVQTALVVYLKYCYHKNMIPEFTQLEEAY